MTSTLNLFSGPGCGLLVLDEESVDVHCVQLTDDVEFSSVLTGHLPAGLSESGGRWELTSLDVVMDLWTRPCHSVDLCLVPF